MNLDIGFHLKRPAGFTVEIDIRCEAESMAIIGPSGSGKSTVLDAVAGIEPGAQVLLDGRDLSGLKIHERRVGYVTQDAPLFPHLSVRENILYSPRAQHAEEVAEALGIGHQLDRRPRNLSGGERRRVAIARAIASRPDLLLLDEPFSGLDEPRRREAMSLLDQIRQHFGVPMILVSHLADEVIGLADWAVRLERGRVVATGQITDVLRAGETRIDNYFTARVCGPDHVRTADGVDLIVPLPPNTAGTVRLAVYAHDVILAAGIPEGISARNCFWTKIRSMTKAADVVLVTLESPVLRVLITSDAAQSMDLQPGKQVGAVIKATSIAYMGACR